MFRHVAVAVIAVVIFPFISDAAKVSNCASFKESPVKHQSSLAGATGKLKQITGDLSGCTDERVIFEGGLGGATVTIGKTRLCTGDVENTKYGCKPGQIPPKLCVEMPTIWGVMEGGKFEISKCDKQGINNAIDTVENSNGDLSSLKKLASAYKDGEPLPGVAGANKDAPLSDSKRIADAVAAPAAATVTKDPEIQKKIQTDPQMLQAMAEGDPKKIEELGKKLGLSNDQAEELAKKATALNPEAGINNNRQGGHTKDWDCLASIHPIYVVPGKYGPDCFNHPLHPTNQQTSAQNMWPASTYANPTDAVENQNQSSSSSLFSQLGSMLQNLFKNFKMPQFGAKKDEKKPPQTPQTPQNPSIGNPNVTATTTPFAPELLKPILAIIPQRREVRGGEAMFVSWSSVRVLSEPRCTLSISGAAGNIGIGQGNNGVQTVPTSSSMSGSVLFTLKCFSLAKEEVMATTSVTIL
ncbi:hypothetical protein HY969_02790 [Candidatus Kaiserbacteria bacterium]|nr:hypothetical protein [Candidatus Kaiserbacteria bacterium]